MIPIIVVRYRNPEVEGRCIAAVQNFADPDRYGLYELDNGVADDNLASVWNRQVEAVAGRRDVDSFLLLNTDAFLVDPDSLLSMERALNSSDRIAAVGPMTDNAGSTQAISHAFWSHSHKADLGRPGGRFQGEVLIDHHISGFCLLVRLAAWEDLGGFPEDGPFYGQESAFIEAAWAKGWHVVTCLDAFVEHLGGATAKKYLDQDEERQKGAAWFRDYRRRLTG